MENDVRDKVCREGLGKNVRFMGIVGNVYDYMCAFDVFLFPSHVEGLPVVLVEAQASGLPCVITDTISEEIVFSDNVHKMSLSQSDDEWADVCLNVVGTTDRRQLNEQVRKRGFDISREVHHLAAIYTALAEER